MQLRKRVQMDGMINNLYRSFLNGDISFPLTRGVTLFQDSGRTTLLLFKAISHVIPVAEVESR